MLNVNAVIRKAHKCDAYRPASDLCSPTAIALVQMHHLSPGHVWQAYFPMIGPLPPTVHAVATISGFLQYVLSFCFKALNPSLAFYQYGIQAIFLNIT